MLLFTIIIIIFVILSVTIYNKSKQGKQKELKAKRSKEEWAQKMAEIRKQKRIERDAEEARKAEMLEQRKLEAEKKLAEIEEEKKSYYTQLQNQFDAIGANMILEKVKGDYMYTVNTTENIDINKLFSIFNKDKTRYRNCYIKDIYGKNLISIDHINSVECLMVFEQEGQEKIFNKGNVVKQVEDFLFCYLGNRKIKRLENSLLSIIENGITQADKLSIIGNTIEEQVSSALENSDYDIDFQKNIDCAKDNDMLIVDYKLPNMSNISDIKEYKYIASKKEISIKKYTDSYIAKRYEDVLYSITLRSLYEIFSIDTSNEINGVTFNGFVTQVNPATGITERKCILSIQVDRQKFSQINLSQVEPKACFKALKGVSAAKLIDISPITPILTFNKKDRRFVEGKDVEVNQGTNLAAMHWEDFEHLVRELFEMEFARNGGEVRVTQASRDGGVDAIVFDPDPLRGGKIVIQAKRYTNTVGVSAVRDLYGTVINEGANSGILITTSDYGHDSYEFAKDKPLKLLNGGHLLALLHKNGRTAHINIEEAKKINEENRNS